MTLSGNETQYLFSEADVRDSETDLFSRPVLGELVFPLSFKLMWNIPLAVRPFLPWYFHSLDFLDASMWGFVLAAVFTSSPVSGPSAPGIVSLPADLSDIGVVPLETLVVPEDCAPALAVDSVVDKPAVSQDEDLDVPLATLASNLFAGVSTGDDGRGGDEIIVVTESHVGEAPPPAFEKEKEGGGQKAEVPVAGVNQAESPRFSSYLPTLSEHLGVALSLLLLGAVSCTCVSFSVLLYLLPLFRSFLHFY